MLVHHEEGSGPPLVLLHGIGSRWQVWKPVIARLAQERHVLAVDLPGFGASLPLPPGESVSPHALARAVAAFLDHKGLERAHVAGNSMGGWVALELAALNRALSVTAISPAGFWTRGELRYARLSLEIGRRLGQLLRPAMRALARSPRGRRAIFAQSFFRGERMTPEEALETLDAYFDAPSFDAALQAMDAEFTFRRDADVRCKTTFLWGAHDRLLLPRQLERAQARFPGSRGVLLPDAGHAPFWDSPGEVAGFILQGSSTP